MILIKGNSMYKEADDFKPIPTGYPELIGVIKFAFIPVKMYDNKWLWMKKYVLRGFFPLGKEPYNIRYAYNLHKERNHGKALS